MHAIMHSMKHSVMNSIASGSMALLRSSWLAYLLLARCEILRVCLPANPPPRTLDGIAMKSVD